MTIAERGFPASSALQGGSMTKKSPASLVPKPMRVPCTSALGAAAASSVCSSLGSSSLLSTTPAPAPSSSLLSKGSPAAAPPACSASSAGEAADPPSSEPSLSDPDATDPSSLPSLPPEPLELEPGLCTPAMPTTAAACSASSHTHTERGCAPTVPSVPRNNTGTFASAA